MHENDEIDIIIRNYTCIYNALHHVCRYEHPGAAVLTTFGKGIHKFLNIEDSIVYLSLQDPGNPPPSSYNETKTVSIWRPSGRIKVDKNSNYYLTHKYSYYCCIL